MMHRSLLRILLGLTIGLFTGTSLATGVLPVVISRLFGMNSFELLIGLRGWTLPLIIFWAIAGGWLGWQGGRQTGGLLLGLSGIISGLFLGVLAFGGALSIVVVSMVTGLIYGGVGGLIIGYVFPTNPDEPEPTG